MGVVEERLELDIGSALASVGALEEALTNSTAGFQASVDAAVESFRSQLDGLSGEQVVVPIDADLDALRSELDAVETETIEVQVEADTSSLVDELENVEAASVSAGQGLGGLGDAAADAVGGSDALQGSLLGVGGALGSAAGGTAGLLTALGKAGPLAAGVAAAVGGLIAVTGPFVADAQDARTALDRFNRVLGDTAERIEGIQLEGVADGLSELAIAAGADDDTLRITAARLFEVGRSAGIAEPAIATYVERLILLATRASVTNPILGSTSDIIDGLSKGLSRGGKFLDQYGFSLTAAEIADRALIASGKASTDQLTVVEKSAAGAALAFERLGEARIRSDIADNLDQPVIKLRALQTAAKEAGEAAAGDLVDSFVDLRESAAPLATGIGVLLVGALRALVEVAKPLALVIQGIGYAVGGLGLGLNFLVTKFQEAQAAAADFIGGFRDMLPGPVQSLLGLGNAAKNDAKPALEDFGTEVADEARHLQDLERAALDADRAIGDTLSATLAAFAANESQRDAQRAYAEAIRETGHSSEQTRDATIRLAEANADLRIKQLLLENPLATNAEKAHLQAEAYRVLAAKAGNKGLAAELNLLADKLDRVATRRPSTVVEVRVAEAEAAVAKISGLLLGLGGKTTTTTLKVNTLYGGADGDPTTPRAHGGPFQANQLLLVGEQGPELVRFPQGGNVVTAQDTKAQLGGPTFRDLIVHEVAGDPRATLFLINSELGAGATR